ncbi:MAG: excinuclease ABC subunit UvrC [Betaproteobacteria bacterium]
MTTKSNKKKVLSFDGRAFSKTLPELPGVYRMLGDEGAVLYIGKAVSLKKRVSSYFRESSNLSPRIQLMIAQVKDIEITVTRSESEALILENSLIKSLKPKYNILFRDDKSYPYVVLTHHDFPKLGSYRGSLAKRHQYFGPFTNTYAVRDSISLLQRVFKLRTCEDSVFANRSRPCLLFQIQRCSGPCVKAINDDQYQMEVKNAAMFLNGKENELMQTLEQSMSHFSMTQEYEKAALIRDQIRSLARVRETQFVTTKREGGIDVIAASSCEGVVGINLTMIRNGAHRGDKVFFPQHATSGDEIEAIEAFVAQHYESGEVPEEILLSHAIQEKFFANALAGDKTRKIKINSKPIGERRVWLAMAVKNAQIAIETRLQSREAQSERALSLQQELGLEGAVARIECFDISHMMGESTVASCVVYDEGRMQSNEYRRFNIDEIKGGDDYAAINNVVTRRYKRAIESGGRLPDLILIDGGKGQVSAAQEALLDVGFSGVYLVGVAKGEERKAGKEQLILAWTGEVLSLGERSPGLHLIQQIRDEAHRFAIQGHRKRRAKKRNRSSLEDIEGVGAKRRQRLLAQFGGVREVSAASIDEIAKVDGISRKLAELIYKQLH